MKCPIFVVTQHGSSVVSGREEAAKSDSDWNQLTNHLCSWFQFHW